MDNRKICEATIERIKEDNSELGGKGAFFLTSLELKEIEIGIKQFERGEVIGWDDFLKSILGGLDLKN